MKIFCPSPLQRFGRKHFLLRWSNVERNALFAGMPLLIQEQSDQDSRHVRPNCHNRQKRPKEMRGNLWILRAEWPSHKPKKKVFFFSPRRRALQFKRIDVTQMCVTSPFNDRNGGPFRPRLPFLQFFFAAAGTMFQFASMPVIPSLPFLD